MQRKQINDFASSQTMSLTKLEGIIIVSCSVVGGLIFICLLSFYFFRKHKLQKSDEIKYDGIPANEQHTEPKNSFEDAETNEYSTQHTDEDEDSPLKSKQPTISMGESTKRILSMDSNTSLFQNRWGDWNSTLLSINPHVSMNDMIQYPHKCEEPPSSDPKPINKLLPPIQTPSETLLAFTESDWKMFGLIHSKYGQKLNKFYPSDLTRFVQGYAHMEDRETATCDRIDALVERGFSPNAEWDFEHILDSPMPQNEEAECLKAWPVFMYGYDKEGHPVLYDQIGCSSLSELDACFDGKMHKLKTFRYRNLMRLQNVKRIQSLRYGYDNCVNDKGGMHPNQLIAF